MSVEVIAMIVIITVLFLPIIVVMLIVVLKKSPLDKAFSLYFKELDKELDDSKCDKSERGRKHMKKIWKHVRSYLQFLMV